MSIGKVYLTKRGRNLIAKGAAGQQIRFTRFAIGDGSLTGQAIEDMNSLLGYKHTVTIGRKQVKDTGILKLSGNLSNSERGGFYYRELGLFATDPDLGEILYAYGNAGIMAEYIPLFQEEVYEKTIILNVYHGNAESVTAVIDESLIFATKTEIEEICVLLEGKAEKDLSNVTAESFRTAFASSGLGTEVADKTTLDEVKNKIGATTDTGGTTTAGGIFAKLNAILQQFMSNWTVVRAGKLDNLDKIGNTDDAQSNSTTAGSLFSKINYLVGQINLYLSSIVTWTSQVYARIGSQTDSANSSTSASLHSKTNWILQRFGSYWTDARAAKIDTISSGVINLSNRGVVKSVQRGSISESQKKNSDDMIITVSAINTNKAILIVNSFSESGVSLASKDYDTYYHPSGYIVDSTHIAFNRSQYYRDTQSVYYFEYDWQVIEFY